MSSRHTNWCPIGHTQSVTVVLPLGEIELLGHARQVADAVAAVVVEYVPDPQSVHAAAPVTVLYFPASHAAHGPPLGPVYPALQSGTIHAALDVLPTGEVEPTGHAEQTPPLGPVKPMLHVHAVNVLHALQEAPEFAGHTLHVSVPTMGL